MLSAVHTCVGKSLQKKTQRLDKILRLYLWYVDCRYKLLNYLDFNLYIVPLASCIIAILEKDLRKSKWKL